MKNTYKTIKLFVVILSLLAMKIGAAPLSGVYTINSAAPTSGTNYQSFSAFATDINTNGVSGPVTVNVVASSGPYNEQPVFNAIAGASSVNRIVINGNGNLLTFNSSNFNQPATLGLNGTDWLTINNLNIEAQGATYAFAIVLYAGADDNTFSTCTFSTPANGTSSSQIPVVISGANNNYYTSSNSGSRNKFTECQMFSGYFCITLYGPSAAPRNLGNTFEKCKIEDFYYYGVYTVYHWNMTFKNNLIQRLTRTNLPSQVYALTVQYCYGTILDGNTITKLYEANQTNTGQVYGIYLYNYSYPVPPDMTFKPIVRNNIVCDIKHNGSIYAMYLWYCHAEIYNNTISLDYLGATSGSAYGIYYYGQTGQETDFKNNIFSITRGGSGVRYGFYFALAGNATSSKNDFYVNGSGGTNYYGYYNGNQTGLSNFQAAAAGLEANSMTLNPTFVSITDVHPTNAAMDNLATPVGLVFDQMGAVRNPTTPDIGALEFLTPQCAGVPGSNSITTPNYAICPGETVNMGLSSLNANTGFTYQWQSSTISQVGPFTNIAGATGLFYTAPTVTANTYFNLVMTCTVGGGSANYVGQVMVAGPSQSAIPYYEGFEGIGLANRLPNCSWYAPSLGGNFQTYIAAASANRVPKNGSSFASFSAPSSNNYVYTNAIQMEPGITYSAAVHYATEYFGYTNWTNLSIWIGPNQNPTGLVQVASVGPAITGPYKLLDGLFTVPSSGLYYMAIRANGAAGSAQYLSIDDISITVPCYGPGAVNTPTMNLSASATTVCAGDAVNLTANGADAYLWSPSGSTNPGIVDNPMATTNYIVWGTNTLTGCTATLNQMVVVNPSPNVFIVPNTPTVCAGSPVNLMALGTGIVAYSWSNGSSQANITVNPTTPTTYTVIATNIDGCSGVATQMIGVSPLPSVNAISSMPDVACHNEMVTLTASGGVSYNWYSSSASTLYHGNPISIIPGVPTVYTVVATNAAGCSNKTTLTQNVADCTSLTELGSLTGLKVYPNPTNGMFTVELNNTLVKTIEITDITGRVIASNTSSDVQVNVDIQNLASGVYYVKIQSENVSEVIKVVKQ
jgi:hypothetical protein